MLAGPSWGRVSPATVIALLTEPSTGRAPHGATTGRHAGHSCWVDAWMREVLPWQGVETQLQAYQRKGLPPHPKVGSTPSICRRSRRQLAGPEMLTQRGTELSAATNFSMATS